MHTKLLFLFIVLSISVQYGLAQTRDEKDILAVLRQEEKAWSSGDVEAYVELYAPLDSTRMILKKGAAIGKENILAFYKKYWPKERMGTLTLDGEQLERISKKFYYVTGYFHVKYLDGKVQDGRYSSLMIKLKARWYIYTDHSG